MPGFQGLTGTFVHLIFHGERISSEPNPGIAAWALLYFLLGGSNEGVQANVAAQRRLFYDFQGLSPVGQPVPEPWKQDEQQGKQKIQHDGCCQVHVNHSPLSLSRHTVPHCQELSDP